MATAKIEYPPSNQILPGSHLLQSAPFPESRLTNGLASDKARVEASPESILVEWSSKLNQLLHGDDVSVEEIFLQSSCWRDLLCMSWDFRTVQGLDRVSKFISQSSKTSRISHIDIYRSPAHKIPRIGTLENLELVQAFIKVETSTGRGQGFIQLAQDVADNGKWKAFTLFTYLEELKDHPEDIKTRRPTGHERDQSHEQLNWKDRRRAQQNFEGGREPTVLILGM